MSPFGFGGAAEAASFPGREELRTEFLAALLRFLTRAAACRLEMSLCLAVLGTAVVGGEIKPAADAPQALPPQESLNRFKLAPGFRLELVASEPMLADPVGMGFDERGRRFVCEIHGYNLEGHYDVIELNNICTYGHPARVFPDAPPDPWRLKRSQDPEWVEFYGAAETDMGLVTAACAPHIYRGDQFPPEYRGAHFSCECAYNLIHLCRLQPDGARYQAVRAIENGEFLTSSEQWFRPVNLAGGPDGAP